MSILVGARTVSPAEVWFALAGDEDSHASQIVRSLRVPRTVTGLLVGAALGAAGALMQALTRNPLADPGLIGISAGASLAVTVAATIGVAGSTFGALAPAFAGAILISAAVSALGTNGKRSIDPVRLVLAGVALTAVLTGITTSLTLMAPAAFDELRNWNVGSLVVSNGQQTSWFSIAILLGIGASLLLSSPIDAIALGEEVAAAQGVRVRRVRLLGVVAVALLTAAATALAGPIAFAALIVPHIARLLVGTGHVAITLCSILLGPLVILLADSLGRILVLPGELPVGVMTALIGAPTLIILIRIRKTAGL